ncbi:serine/threonine-protein kinase gcn2 [Apiospora arundinis]|uniref:non-specific serine/threonine protein kinase n=1 Tax=Apiospora arundinis TaxID=335852 RepID=A0ABR2I047_9PEZI
MSPWKTKSDSNPPTSPPAGPGPRSQYIDAQQEEIGVLKAIYEDGVDFIEHKAANAAWQRSEPSFDIRIKALSNQDFTVTLGVVLTATYPKSAPLLSLKDDTNLSESTLFKIQKFIEKKPKDLAAQGQCEPMIHELALGIHEYLEDAALAKAQGLTLPSLEEERAAHEAELARQAQEQEEEEARKKQEASLEEERVMQQMIDEEMRRKKESSKKSRQKSHPKTPSFLPENSQHSMADRVVFDGTCKLTDSSGNEMHFNTVEGKCDARRGLVATVYTVEPSNLRCTLLALKETVLKPGTSDVVQFKKRMSSLENKLRSVKKLSHPNVLQLIDFRIDQVSEDGDEDEDARSNDRIVRVLMPLADRDSLYEDLERNGSLPPGRLRAWTTDLLSALEYLQSQGLVHGDIHPGNILLCKENSRNYVPKLADVAYQRELHTICSKSRTKSSLNSAKSVYWSPPEVAGSSAPLSHKTDVWDFGIVFLQMIWGLDVFETYEGPAMLMETLSLSNTLHELISKFFKADASRRPRAADLRSSEFLATDAPILVEESIGFHSSGQTLAAMPPGFSRKRLDSVSAAPSFSRFANDFTEEGRLGKGGFGEVVKVRKKIDGQLYAIKKISQRASRTLTTTLKEVMTLSRLSHPAIVRYYDAWIERVPIDTYETDGDSSTEGPQTHDEGNAESDGIDIQFATSTGGLDFMSSTNAAGDFDFEESTDDDELTDGEDDDSEEEDSDDEDSDELDSDSDDNESSNADQMPGSLKRIRSHQASYKNILYIHMEYCEKRTLRDLISQGLYQNTKEVWRLFREIVEGIVHIHSLHNLVHRDLKPENIFISLGADGVAHVKIGDFGLATSGHINNQKGLIGSQDSKEMSNVGTAIYLAPELERSNIEDSRKIDMYALGIVFFEMSYKPMLGHERWTVLNDLRAPSPSLPSDFKPGDKMQTEVILSLVTHNPKERPTSSELLRSGKLPMAEESETIQRTLAEIVDPMSPHYQKTVSTLFSVTTEQSKDYTWDMTTPNPSSLELLYQGVVKDELISIFRRHGALEASRNPLYPRSSHYSQPVVEMLDRSGTVLQMPYDLMLGHARTLAKHTGSSVVPKSFAFDKIFRERSGGGQPLMYSEVCFDIVSTDTLDLALKEAHAIMVLDDIVDAFPSLSQMCFHVSHSDLLQLIFDFCEVDVNLRKVAAESMTKLNIHSWNWSKIRTELRSLGLSATSIDELQKFDFRDTPVKAFTRLKSLFDGNNIFEKVQSTIAHLKDVVSYAKRLGVHNKIYINPLSSFREDFFQGGILFQCVYDKKFRDVFAAGGRYDSLIREHRPKLGNKNEQRHAVGFSLSWEKLARIPKPAGSSKSFMKKVEPEAKGIFKAKRCEALVASFDPALLRSAGVELVGTLIRSGVSAELACDSRSPEDLQNKYRDETYSWMIIIKQDLLKVKTMDRKDVADVDMPTSQLMGWLRGEMRDRERSRVIRPAHAASNSNTNTAAVEDGFPVNTEQEVAVLVANTKSKKFNRLAVVEQAQACMAKIHWNSLEGPVVAVETSDTVLELIRKTSLSDADSWRKAEQLVNMAERKYLREIHDLLMSWRTEWQTKNGTRTRDAGVYNFRTMNGIYYDLGA